MEAVNYRQCLSLFLLLYIATKLVELRLWTSNDALCIVAFRRLSGSRLVAFLFQAMQLSSEHEAPVNAKNQNKQQYFLVDCFVYRIWKLCLGLGQTRGNDKESPKSISPPQILFTSILSLMMDLSWVIDHLYKQWLITNHIILIEN